MFRISRRLLADTTAPASFTHLSTTTGRPRMVDVSSKVPTARTAVAVGRVRVQPSTVASLRALDTHGNPPATATAAPSLKKGGQVFTVAQLAGVMASKRCAELIPLCHPLQLTHSDVRLQLNEAESAVEISATCRCHGPTGVEMEALTACSVAALTVYDMLKAVDKRMTIEGIRLQSKTGGRTETAAAPSQ